MLAMTLRQLAVMQAWLLIDDYAIKNLLTHSVRSVEKMSQQIHDCRMIYQQPHLHHSQLMKGHNHTKHCSRCRVGMYLETVAQPAG